MNFRLNNYAMSTDRKYDQEWYEWCVFVDGERSLVERITRVQYTLHPTFPDPIRTITDKEHRFALLSSGWGQFEIRAEITTLDGVPYLRQYGLDLSKAWPIGPSASGIKEPLSLAVYNILMEGKFRWRKVRTIASRTSLPEEDVRRTLVDLQGGGFVRKLPQPSLDGQDLWAATCIVGLLPSL